MEHNSSMWNVDVIVMFRTWNSWLVECVNSLLALEPPCRQILLIPDEALPFDVIEKLNNLAPPEKMRVIHSGVGKNPCEKRNIGMDTSSAQIVGFIDDDARAWPDWLGKARRHFDEPDVYVVGGPNVTPPESTPWQRAFGNVMASPLGMGNGYIRHIQSYPAREVSEVPGCNMLIRNIKSLRFDPAIYPADDITFCRLARTLGGVIVYDPEVGVFHQRRATLKGFIEQIYGYGLYGKMASLNSWWRAIPALFFVYVVLMLLALVLAPAYWAIWIWPSCLYVVVHWLECLRLCKFKRIIWRTFICFFVAHMAYGVGYWKACFKSLLAPVKPAKQDHS